MIKYDFEKHGESFNGLLLDSSTLEILHQPVVWADETVVALVGSPDVFLASPPAPS